MQNLVWLSAFASAGLSAGILSGLFGVGGGTLVVPLLLMLGIPIHHAVGMSLVYILFASASGSVKHYRQHNIQFRSVILMCLAAFCTIYLGVQVSKALDPRTLSLAFSALMLMVLGLFAYRLRLKEKPSNESTQPKAIALIATGLVAGLFSSLFGVGGGFIMVPLLVMLTPLSIKKAAGTSLAAIFFISCVGIVQHYLFGSLSQALDAQLIPLTVMSFAGLVGAPLGAWLNNKLPAKRLQQGFMVFLLLITVYMFFQGG